MATNGAHGLVVSVSVLLVALLAAPGRGALLERAASRPAASAGQHPVVAVAGDIACDPGSSNYRDGRGTATACRQRHTSRLLLDRSVFARLDAVLTAGDNQYDDGSLAKFRVSYGAAWGRPALKPITRPAPGNHDYGTPGAAGYFDYFGAAAGAPGEGYYSFEVGSWHVIALNSNCGAVGGCGARSAQGRWLRADLAASSALCTLAYWHHPRFSSGLHGGSVAYRELWRVLYGANADLVVAGHDHHYERFAPQGPGGRLDPERGIREFVVGTGGASLYPVVTVAANSEFRDARTFGVLKLTLGPRSYDWQFVSERRAIRDRGSGSCH